MRILVRISCTLLLAAACLIAQSDNSYITGIVKDPSGAAVVNAKVTVFNEDTRFEREASTNATGFYTITNLSPGYYTLTIEAPGFKKFQRTRNKLEAAQPLGVNVDLALGQITETVNVEASVAQLQTESATVGKTVEEKQIQTLSLNGRNPLFLALLKPGVRGGAMSGFSFGLTSGGFAMNGGRSQDSLITFDGAVGIRTRANGTSIGTADLDTVQEVQILTANYAAEYGRSAAGQIRMVTRSGSRDFHGSLYNQLRNSALDANSFDRNRNPATNFVAPFKFNQFGYVFSGPVTIPGKFNKNREKLFFLWAQEWVKFRREQTSFARVPTTLMREGNFSELLSPNAYYSGTRNIIDPLTISAANPAGTAFPGNVIPQGRLSRNGIAFLRTFPTPLAPGATQPFAGNTNWFLVRPNPQDQRKDTLSIDYNPTANQVFKFRTSNYNWKSLDAFRGAFDYAITDWSRPNRTATLGHTWTLSPTMINEFLVGASVDRVFINVDRTGERYLRSRSGINYPYIFPEPKEINDKIPTIEIPNLSTIDGGPYPARSTGPIYQISNNLTKIFGNHTFKFGGTWERSGQNDFDQINVSGVPGGTNNQNGRFVFTDTLPGGAPSTNIGISNAALGLFSTYAEIGPRSFTPYRGHGFEWFGQDAWRVNSKLKLEIGVRGSWNSGYYKSLWGNIAYFDPNKYDPARAVVQDPATGNILSGDRFNGVVIPGSAFPAAGKGRVPAIDSGEFNRLLSGGSPYPSQSSHIIAPRIGVAYQLTPKQVVRAGFGGFVSRPGVYDSVFLGGNPPWQPMASITNGSADNPGGASRVNFPQFFMTIDPVYQIPRSYNWNVTYQREIGFETTLEVAYVGTAGNYLSRERALNQLPFGTTFRPENLNPNGSQRFNVNSLRPFRGYANIPMLEHSGRSEYNAAQVELSRRFKRGFSYGFAYTLSKAMDGNSGPRDGFYDVGNQGLNWGKANFDTRHVAVLNFIWEMPFFRNGNRLTKAALGGWQLTGTQQFQTGTPFTVGNGDDFYGIGESNFKPWNLNGTPNQPRQFAAQNTDASFWFEPTAGNGAWATRPVNGTYGNQNRNSIGFHQPGFQNWNLSMLKNFAINDRNGVEFRFDAFNWVNHPNWNGADTNPTSANFGKITGKNSQRELQLSLRYRF